MLDAMRNQASSWVVRGLLVLLILSFAIWGIGDVFFGPRGGQTIAEVGDLEVTGTEVNREFDDQINRFRQQFNTPLDRGQAVAFGLLNQAMQAKIAQRLVDMHGLDLGLGVADSSVRAAITENPVFRGSAGFDRDRLDVVLRSQGMTEDAFIEEVRDDLRRAMLIDAVSGLVVIPQEEASRIYAYRNEERRGTALHLLSAAIVIADPDDSVLESWLDGHKDEFKAPEYRSGVAVVIEPESLVGEIDVTPDELQSAYDARIASFTTPEKRKVGQLLAHDEAVIGKAREQIENGATMAEIAEALAGEGVSYSSIGPLARHDLPASLGDPVFALPDTESISAPVQSAFGWHLFRLIEVEPEKVRPLDEVRQQLHDDLALEHARAQLPDLANSLDDEVAAGSDLETAAGQLNFPVVKLDMVDRNGEHADGSPLDNDTISGDVLGRFFSGARGETSLLEQTDDGYLMYRVDSIDPPRDRTLDEIHDKVLAAWKAGQQQKRAMEDAALIVERLHAGATLEAIAAEKGDAATLVDIEPVKRNADPAAAGINAEVLATLFELEQGTASTKPIDVGDGAVIVREDEVIPAAEPESLDPLKEELRMQEQNDLLVQYEQALRHRYPVQINEAALRALATALSPTQ
ncbi:MAG: peptidyl-prolyl cis-trans isomerase [Geminicoccaceae bacterium]|nr:peptidyl-prolyl cis-trans isomerase [Geminicoccaceae bacterium]